MCILLLQRYFYVVTTVMLHGNKRMGPITLASPCLTETLADDPYWPQEELKINFSHFTSLHVTNTNYCTALCTAENVKRVW